MWQETKPYYSEKAKLELLRKAPPEKLMEFVVIMTRRADDGKAD